MRAFWLSATFLFSFTGLSFAQQNQQKVCSQVTDVCVSYSSSTPFVFNKEAQFTLTIQDADNAEIQLVKVDLWMEMGNHGHGSSPLKVTPKSSELYEITKAYFVMKGNWQIRVTYKHEDFQETLLLLAQVY